MSFPSWFQTVGEDFRVVVTFVVVAQEVIILLRLKDCHNIRCYGSRIVMAFVAAQGWW